MQFAIILSVSLFTLAIVPHGMPLAVGADMNCTDCHSEIAEGAVVHKPIKTFGCFVCHLKDTKGKTPLKKDMPDDHPRILPIDSSRLDATCLQCHDKVDASLKKAKNKHPALDMGCTTCHRPHNSKFPHLLKQKPQDLCLECHDTIKPQISGKYQHGAVTDAKSCLNCHDGHSSAQKKLLLKPVAQLCIDCHSKEYKDPKGLIVPNMKAFLDKNPVKHSPVESGDCADCHAPHGSNERGMSKAAVPADFYTSFGDKKYALCWTCHSADMITADKTTSTTEFRNGDQNLHALHVKNVRKPMTCFACHDIHASTNPKLIEKWVDYRGVKMPIQFDKTAQGGSCTTACHGQKVYNREKAAANTQGR